MDAVGFALASAVGRDARDNWRIIGTANNLPDELPFDGEGVADDDYVVLVGGDGEELGAVRVLDRATGVWTVGTAYSAAADLFGGHMFAGLGDGLFYYAGGRTSAWVATTRAYDPVLDTWTAKANMPLATTDGGYCSHGGFGYVFGGRTAASTYRADTRRYDPVANSWTTLASRPVSGYINAAAPILEDGNTVVLIGLRTSVISDRVDTYDIALNTWTANAFPDVPALFSWTERSQGWRSPEGITLARPGLARAVALDPDAGTWGPVVELTGLQNLKSTFVPLGDGTALQAGLNQGASGSSAVYIAKPPGVPLADANTGAVRAWLAAT
jgi:hypothetical protein